MTLTRRHSQVVAALQVLVVHVVDAGRVFIIIKIAPLSLALSNLIAEAVAECAESLKVTLPYPVTAIAEI